MRSYTPVVSLKAKTKIDKVYTRFQTKTAQQQYPPPPDYKDRAVRSEQTCLDHGPHYSARSKRFGSRCPSENVRSELTERDWENAVQGLGKEHARWHVATTSRGSKITPFGSSRILNLIWFFVLELQNSIPQYSRSDLSLLHVRVATTSWWNLSPRVFRLLCLRPRNFMPAPPPAPPLRS